VKGKYHGKGEVCRGCVIEIMDWTIWLDDVSPCELLVNDHSVIGRMVESTKETGKTARLMAMAGRSDRMAPSATTVNGKMTNPFVIPR
jgi:hypothetical protein